MRLFRRICYLLRLRRETRELAEEIEQHRALAENAQRKAGLSGDEARSKSRRLMGNTGLALEDARQVWLGTWIESVAQDLRYALRSLANQPGFTLMALLALVLGIGLNTSLFTSINALASRSWDVPEPDRVVTAFPVTQRGPVSGFALTAARFLNENSRTIEGALAFRTTRLELDGAAGGPGVNAAYVTGNFFDVLHVPMKIGRPFTKEDDAIASPGAVAVISNFLWTERYGASGEMLGRTIRLDGVPFTVIGIAAESFNGVTESRTDVWIPFASIRLVRGKDQAALSLLTDPGRCCSDVAMRLLPGISREQAQYELNTLFQQYLIEVNREPAKEFLVSRAPATVMLAGTAMMENPEVRRRLAPMAAVLLGAFGSILLLACANVSNLLLARASARQREIAVRVAIGAGRGRVVRQLLTESLLLGGTASAVALVLAFVLPDLIVRFSGQTRPTNVYLIPDANVLVFAAGVAIVSALAFGLIPALRGTRISVSEAMKLQSTQASPRIPLRGTLLAVQVAISVALLMAAGLLVRGLSHARSVDVRFKTEGVTAVRVTLPANVYDSARQQEFFDNLLAKLDPSGKTAAVSVLVPLEGRREYTGLGAQCASGGFVTGQWISSGYFDVLQIPILAGRNFTRADRGRGSVLVNETLAALCWPGRSPVGERVKPGDREGEIIGVVRDAHVSGVGPVPPTFFAQYTEGPAAVLVPSAAVQPVVSAVREMEPRAATEVIGLSEQANRSLGLTESVARMAGALGLLALLLAAIGLYGVISYSVEQRRREIGMRLALGARPRAVVGLVLQKNIRPALAGLIAGLALAAAVSMLLESQLYGLSPLDPTAFAGVFSVLLVAGFLASVIPARRATQIDPIKTLRQD